MVKGRAAFARLPLGRTIRLALVGLTLLLAALAAVAIGNLYDARQRYEDELARAYELEASSSRLLAAGVIEEASFGTRGSGAGESRRRAAAAFDAEAKRALALARGDAESQRLVRARIGAQQRVRELARPLRGGRRSP